MRAVVVVVDGLDRTRDSSGLEDMVVFVCDIDSRDDCQKAGDVVYIGQENGTQSKQ